MGHKLLSRFRKQGKSTSTFISKLRALAKLCNFGTSMDIMLCDRLVCGVSDSHIQRRPLLEPDLTWQTAMQIVLGMESTAQNVRILQGGGEASKAISGEVLKFTAAKPGSSNKQMPSCTCCGMPGHYPLKCRFKEAKCHHCGIRDT